MDGMGETGRRLPERLEGHGLVLQRWTVADAEAMDAAITGNVEHLRARMHWIGFEPQTIEQRRELLELWDAVWAEGKDAVYAIHLGPDVVGSAGLHDRIGPDALEIGYWVDHRHLGRGIAARASAVLTDAAFARPGIERVVILHDITNEASRRVPEKLGYRQVGEVTSERDLAPADVGRDVVWEVDRATWAARSA